MKLTTDDNVVIAADWYHGPTLTSQVIVISPGFAQNKATQSMQGLAAGLLPQSDLIMLDYRGTGQSGDSFWFGSKEYQDLIIYLRFARTRYSHVKLLGFSLGAYTALRTASEYPGVADELYLVSCPISLDAIVTSGGAFLQPLERPFQKMVSKAGPLSSNPNFRWGPLFAAKPDGRLLAKELKTPVSFLSGSQDKLVFAKMSRRVFDAVPGQKAWAVQDGGLHAEMMFFQDPEGFKAWMKKGAGEESPRGK
jgi:pimeloyl-ACP methyl ester carboxylesterase